MSVSIFDEHPTPSWIVDGDLRVLEMNRAARELVGAGPAAEGPVTSGGELLACVNALGPAGCGRHQACSSCVVRGAVARALSTGQVQRNAADVRTRRGGAETTASLLASASPMRLGGAPAVLLTLEDVTDVVRLRSAREAAERSLREREVEYETVFEHVAEGVVLAALDGRFLRWNPAALDIHGFGPGAPAPRSHAELQERLELTALDGAPLPPEEWPLARVLRGERLRGVLLRVRERAGRWSRVLSYAGALARDGGRPFMAVLTVTDATQREEQAELLRDRERQLSLVLEASNDGFWDFEPDRMRFALSPRCFEIVGAARDTRSSSPGFWWERVHPGDAPDFRRAIAAHFAGRTARLDVEFRLRYGDGVWRWVRALGKAVERDASGRPRRVSGTLRDVTERHEDRERLRAALAANEELVEELRGALQKVRTLSGLLPVCAWCRKVRDDQGYWKRLESYISEHSDARFSHGMCPECYAREFPATE